MKSLLALLILLAAATFSFAQNEQAPILEKDIAYKDWTYKNIRTGEDVNLRNFAKDKKLVMVVYFAPWCPNWRHDAPMLQKLYDKYKDQGLGVVAVGVYDPVDSMRKNLDALKITFPAVYESELRSDKQKTLHYQYRRSTGDARGWGSPWYIFLSPKTMEKKGETLINRAFVINGELIEKEGEEFIRKHLLLKTPLAANDPIEVCDPDKKLAELQKP